MIRILFLYLGYSIVRCLTILLSIRLQLSRPKNISKIIERNIIFGSTFIKKYFALIKCLIFLIYFNYNNYCYSVVLSFYLEACFANTRYTTLNYKQFFFFFSLTYSLCVKSNNNTLISRSRQVQSFSMEIFATYEKFCTEVLMCCDSRKLRVRFIIYSNYILSFFFFFSFLSNKKIFIINIFNNYIIILL